MQNTQTVVLASEEGEHFDVLIVGASLSGIGSAYRLKKELPGKSFVVLDALAGFGGTWLIHRYPGIRSDTDLHTYAYSFKPWYGKPIATGQEILDYLGEVIAENDLAGHIRYGHRVISANWSSKIGAWIVEADTSEGARKIFSARFLWMCQGYYRHSQGYTPEWKNIDKFKGQIVHPQTWPEEFDLSNKKVVLIGSGATAATLLPSIADDCGHMTLLQRSPTYFRIGENAIPLVEELRALNIDPLWIHEITRRKLLFDQYKLFQRCASEPDKVKQELVGAIKAWLGPGYDDLVDKHFTPRYRPGAQRIAFVPGGDLFECIRAGKASIKTDAINRFTENGILLECGEELNADVIITATGFNLSPLGDVKFVVDGKPLDFSETVTFKGMMFTGLPNMLWVMGYLRASWTLRVEMLADFVCRLLKHMDEKGAKKVEVKPGPEDQDMAILPWVDTNDFNPSYMLRSIHLLPKRGDRPEWTHNLDYWDEKDKIAALDLDDVVFVYE